MMRSRKFWMLVAVVLLAACANETDEVLEGFNIDVEEEAPLDVVGVESDPLWNAEQLDDSVADPPFAGDGISRVPSDRLRTQVEPDPEPWKQPEEID